MQNMVWKLVVLVGVVGASCGLVYQAHKSLTEVQKQKEQGEFSPLGDGEELTSAPLATTPPVTDSPLSSEITPASDLLTSIPQREENGPEPTPADPVPRPSLFADAMNGSSPSQGGNVQPAVGASAGPTPPGIIEQASNEQSGNPFLNFAPRQPEPEIETETPQPSPFMPRLPAAETDNNPEPPATSNTSPLQPRRTPVLLPTPTNDTGLPQQSDENPILQAGSEQSNTPAEESGPLFPFIPTPPAETDNPEPVVPQSTGGNSPFNRFQGENQNSNSAPAFVPRMPDENPAPAVPESNNPFAPRFPADNPTPEPAAAPNPFLPRLPASEENSPEITPVPVVPENTGAGGRLIMPAQNETTEESTDVVPQLGFPTPNATPESVQPERPNPFSSGFPEPTQPESTGLTPLEPAPMPEPVIPFNDSVTPSEPVPTSAAPFFPSQPEPDTTVIPTRPAFPGFGPSEPEPTPDPIVPQNNDSAESRFNNLMNRSNTTDTPPVVPQFPVAGTGTVTPDAPRGPQQPELKIEKIAPAEAVVGEPIIYSILVRNVGGSPAHKVVVEDRIPRGVDPKSLGTSPQAMISEDKLFWELNTLNPGDERKIQLRVTPIESGDIGSVATVRFAASVAASIRVTAPKLTIEMQGPQEIAVGEQIPYIFKVTNSGDGEGRKVFIRALLPPELQHPGGNDIEYEIGNLPPGESRQVELTLTAAAAGQVSPQALVTIDGNVKDDEALNLRIIESRLTLSRKGPQQRFVSRPAGYTNVITNQSSTALEQITVTEHVPAGVEWISQPGGDALWDPNSRTVSWIIPKLLPGEARQLVSQVVSSSVGDFEGAVTVVDAKGNQANLPTSLSVKGFANLEVDVQRGGAPAVAVGEQVAMRVLVNNDGSAPAKNVQARFVIPAGLQFVDAKGPVRHRQAGDTVLFDALPEVPVNGQQSFDIILTATQENRDARVRVELQTAEFTEPLLHEERVQVYQEP
ncbi:MAG: DUF11 domain-containing protein [Planctomycetaceae bacterium]|nr:DUF11 domain-containing protein [Planctomycetaceae bacterium]